ncbi:MULTISPECIES: APH(3') family aminoglycoside O-phosphotransferase [unclassified Ensifer]|uniref:APH(3') family aminoglycoside O-phosphotransferase n=1 Tax=unclassified Ensifer TaxID=2633371 RepID=UPI00081336F5|nr:MULTISPECIES: APH(3') family aminoglycoside O-phosphotransferase [unclassified Ensifer]OCP11174.1 APH(3') family aminoglycoside O-phosphotransferase [Ensifer sp. LC14]OCP12825.1 APH(3') family aminoglycoside O-phosphotransferase [Ensifer sp. LC13]OCP13505.1 APH(3') family aminoglycoside O-phosphotransferase [Ensifer sp. LC11]OCP34268.1 APH(3') family aminoglycoside O-phosphotransferase [Ensifer sp. LC499]
MRIPNIELPENFDPLVTGYDWNRDTLGQSDSSIYLLKAAGRPMLVLKVEAAGPFGEFADEATRLDWLTSQGVPCPQILARAFGAETNWLLLQAVEGTDLASTTLSPKDQIVILANALKRLHALDVAACPFDHRIDKRIAIASARTQAGLIDESDFDEARLGRTAADLFTELQARVPSTKVLVVTHGDACLPNIIESNGRFAGFIDCSRLGVADPYQDIALACRSIAHNLGEEWVSPFLTLYGIDKDDRQKRDFYCLLDEFF